MHNIILLQIQIFKFEENKIFISDKKCILIMIKMYNVQ